MLRHYLAAACDPLDAAGRVARRGDELLRKRCAVDSPKPVVDLEDRTLVRMMSGLGGASGFRVLRTRVSCKVRDWSSGYKGPAQALRRGLTQARRHPGRRCAGVPLA